ncbi:MAG TPA: nitrous oxide-stimulated promoter family protein [Thermoleophilia bacterium]
MIRIPSNRRSDLVTDGKPSRCRARRFRRERRTIEVMVQLYCRENHQSDSRRATGRGARGDGLLCDQCAALLGYAGLRLDACRFAGDKPVCSRCSVHCYSPAMREVVRAVMRYSGPRMLRRHPLLAVSHLFDRRRTPGES